MFTANRVADRLRAVSSSVVLVGAMVRSVASNAGNGETVSFAEHLYPLMTSFGTLIVLTQPVLGVAC